MKFKRPRLAGGIAASEVGTQSRPRDLGRHSPHNQFVDYLVRGVDPDAYRLNPACVERIRDIIKQWFVRLVIEHAQLSEHGLRQYAAPSTGGHGPSSRLSPRVQRARPISGSSGFSFQLRNSVTSAANWVWC